MKQIVQETYMWMYEAFYSRLQRVPGGRLAALCRPTAIAILLTERCNARCLHCNIWQNRGKEDSPTVDQWLATVQDLRRWLGPVHVVFTGGEALLKPFTIEILSNASRLGLAVELLTHGYWGDQSRIEAAAMTNPWRVTLSLDGLGDVHSRIRGREGFFERTAASIDTLLRLRQEHKLRYTIRLKTVIMSHNLDQLEPLARFATREGVDIYYQPIEQQYNTSEDTEWYLRSDNWPSDPEQAIAEVEKLIALKRAGLHIANHEADLRAIQDYFRAPALGEIMRRFHAHGGGKPRCAALGMLQIQSNGDVRVCSYKEPFGNIRGESIRSIWTRRPAYWKSDCCHLQGSEPTGVEGETTITGRA